MLAGGLSPEPGGGGWHYDEIADIMGKKAEAPALASDHEQSPHVRPVTGKNLGSRCYYF